MGPVATAEAAAHAQRQGSTMSTCGGSAGVEWRPRQPAGGRGPGPRLAPLRGCLVLETIFFSACHIGCLDTNLEY